MLLRIKYIYYILLLSFIGLVQPLQANSENDKPDKLSYVIELIEQNKIEKAEIFIRKYITSQKTISEKVKACYAIAVNYNNNLFYNMSLEYAKEGIGYLDSNTYLLVELNQVIIINHLDLKNYDIAESSYWKSARIKTNRKDVKANGFNLIGEIYRLKEEYTKSIPFYHKAIKINKDNSFNESLAINYNNIALSHLYINNIDSAEYYLNQSFKVINDLQLINRKSAINISFGQLYLKKGNYLDALNFFKKTIIFDLSNHPDEFEVYQDAYNGMKDCYELLGDYKNALNSYEMFQEFNTKTTDRRQNAIILQKQILYERSMHTKELSLISAKLELEKKYKNIIVIVLIAVILIIILILYILWLSNKRVKQKVELEINKNRVHKLEIEKMKLTQENLESELIQNKQNQEIKRLERIRLEEQIEANNRELTSTALHIVSKNEILSQIKEKITQIKEDVNDFPIKNYKEIQFLISDSLRFDDDWQVFNKHFTDVHPNFIEKLKTEFSDLTMDELKLCAYLKIQLSSKEIARLINITVAAVNKRRNRLRKKLQLSADEDLYAFFLKK